MATALKNFFNAFKKNPAGFLVPGAKDKMSIALYAAAIVSVGTLFAIMPPFLKEEYEYVYEELGYEEFMEDYNVEYDYELGLYVGNPKAQADAKAKGQAKAAAAPAKAPAKAPVVVPAKAPVVAPAKAPVVAPAAPKVAPVVAPAAPKVAPVVAPVAPAAPRTVTMQITRPTTTVMVPKRKKNTAAQFFLGAFVGYALAFGVGAFIAGFPSIAGGGATGYSRFTYRPRAYKSSMSGDMPSYVPSYYRPSAYQPRSFEGFS